MVCLPTRWVSFLPLPRPGRAVVRLDEMPRTSELLMDEEEFQHNGKLEYFKHRASHHTSLSASLVSFMQSAIRIAFILNGGATIAALSVYGALNGKIPPGAGTHYSAAIGSWAVGLICATGAVFLMGLAQREFQAQVGAEVNARARGWFGVDVEITGTRHAALGQALRIAAVVVWVGSIGAFGWGASEALPGAWARPRRWDSPCRSAARKCAACRSPGLRSIGIECRGRRYARARRGGRRRSS